jgi:DNA mismatch repair protein MutS
LDVLDCKKYINHKFNLCKPEIGENSKPFVKANGLRHCLIEHFQTNELYVSNDVNLGVDGEINGFLLYGTNAVGKTSLIKALGIAIIMAQAGLYVPCGSFTFKPYNMIFTRILGNDNIFKGLSTFEVEMYELKSILKNADPGALILGDELCSGTESDSAISIFVAGLEHLHTRNASFIFATHFHEIVAYSEILNLERLSMKHLTVIYNKTIDKLVYDRILKDGPGESMYGLEVCKSLKLPNDFLDRAHEIRRKYTGDYEILSSKGSKYNIIKLKTE